MVRILSIPRLLSILFFLLMVSPALALELGEVAPDFELPNLAGQQVKLSDFKGRTILLKLATTWCPTCNQQSQEIAGADNFLKENNIVVVEVFLQDSEAMVRDALKGRKLQAQTVELLDDDRVRRAYNVYLIPRVLIIDPQFRLRHDGSLMPTKELIEGLKRAGAPLS